VADTVVGWHHCSAGLLPYLSPPAHHHTADDDDDDDDESTPATQTDFTVVKRDVIQVSLHPTHYTSSCFGENKD